MEEMKGRKIFSIVLLVMVFFTVLAGCGTAKIDGTQASTAAEVSAAATAPAASSPETPKEKAVISFLKWGEGSERDLDMDSIAKFNAANPDIEVKGEVIKYDDYLSKINTLIAANSTPDIFYINEYLPVEWGQKGIGTDLRPYYEKNGTTPEDKYVGAALFKSADNKIWGVASSLATMMVYYNKKLFQDAGIALPSTDAKASWTWDEMLAAAKKITTDKNGKHADEAGFDTKSIKVYGILAPTFWLHNMTLLYSNGASYATPDGKALGLGSPEAIQVMQGVSDLMNKDHIAPSIAVTKSLPASATMLMNGQLGILPSGTWDDVNFVTENYDVGVAPYPTMKTPVSIAWASCYMMSATSKYPDQAFKYLQYVTDGELNENVLKMNLPNLKSYYSDEGKFTQWSDMNKHSADFLKAVPSIMNISITPENVNLKNFGPIVDQTISPEMDKLWLGEKTAEEMVKILEEKTAGKWQGYWDK